jgi:glycosyltransferase involved in cell wall biosynthesis
MKILYHHRTRATDAQRVHIREIIRAFRQLGHEVDVVALADAEKPQEEAKREASESMAKKVALRFPMAYELLQIAYNGFAVPWLVWKIWRKRTDFVYERYSLLNFSGVLAAALTGRPIVLEVNSPFAMEQFQQKEIRAVRFSAFMERVICNAATKVVVVSGPLRRIMIASGVQESRLALIPNGVNLDHLHSDRGESLRTSMGLQDKVVIGFVGWFRKWHGLEFLLETFAASGLGCRGAVLLLIGDGPAMPTLRSYVQDNHLENEVLFAGPIPHEKIAPYLQMIDIAVQPAANEYCCPMKIIEYMGIAKPIVAPRQENIEELLTDGKNSELFKPADAAALSRSLAKLVADAELRLRLGRGALETVHNRGLLWAKNAERVVDLIAQHPTSVRVASERVLG